MKKKINNATQSTCQHAIYCGIKVRTYVVTKNKSFHFLDLSVTCTSIRSLGIKGTCVLIVQV